jgi:hypothetical protein
MEDRLDFPQGLTFDPETLETVGMRKPELRITERLGGIPTGGICSACPTSTFHTGSRRISTVEEHERILKALFDHHFEKVHLREDASQSAARIVREGTEDR